MVGAQEAGLSILKMLLLLRLLLLLVVVVVVVYDNVGLHLAVFEFVLV